MKKLIFVALATLYLSFTAHTQNLNSNTDTLTNENIIELVELGLGKDVLKSKILSSSTKFDVSINGLTKLKKAKVPDEVIASMIEQSSASNSNINNSITPVNEMSKLESGIYYQSPEVRYTEIEPSVMNATSTNSAAQIFVSALINAKLKVSVGGKESSFKIRENQPTIIFVFDTTEKKNLNNDNNRWLSNARSPRDFVLVKLDVKYKSRELTVGKANAISEKSGIDENAIIPFSTEKISKGFYQIRPDKPMKDGEYGIMFSQGYKSGESSKIFDFSIAVKGKK